MAQTLDQLVIELKADIRGLQASLNTADGTLKRFGANAEREATRVDRAFAHAGRMIAGYFSAQLLAGFAKSTVETAMRVESLQAKMVAATGSADAAASSMSFLRAESERLGINFIAAADGFGSFAAAGLRAGLSLSEVKGVFQGVAEAATALQLSPERVSLAFQALSQIAAKGTVSMEELRGQLGEQLPIAMDAAARGMGVTQSRLIEMVSKGEVAAKDFLPKFGAAIRENLGDAVAKASQTAQANLNRMNNAIVDLQTKMAGGAAIKSYTSAINNLAKAVSDPAVQDGLSDLAGAIGYITEITVVGIATWSKWIAKVYEASKAWLANEMAGGDDNPNWRKPGPMNSGGGALAPADKLMAALGEAPTFGGGGGGSAKDDKERDRLKDRIDALKYQLASESEQLAIEYEKRQELLQEALEKQAITEQEYRDLKLEAELDYKNKFGELWVEEAEERLRIEEEAQNAILSNRRTMYGALTSLMSQFGGKSKAFAIAAIAIEKAQAIQSVLIESKKAAIAARAWAMVMGGPAAAEVAYAREIMMGQVTAALIAASGLAQVAMGGGGGGSEGGSSGAGGGTSTVAGPGLQANAAPQAPKTIYINVGNKPWSAEDMRDFVNGMKEFVGDGSVKLDVRGVMA